MAKKTTRRLGITMGILALAAFAPWALAGSGEPDHERPDVPGEPPRLVETAYSALQVTVINDSARASASTGTMTEDPTLNDILSDHGVTIYRQAYPYSKIQQLLDIYEVQCAKCDTFLLKAELDRTGEFSEVRVLKPPVTLDLGNPGGYDPSDHMWWAFAQDWMWNLVITDADLAWNMTRGDPNVLIAVVDTGFDVAHPDLASKMSPIDPSTNLPLFLGPHGTATAGMAAGETAQTGSPALGQMPPICQHP